MAKFVEVTEVQKGSQGEELGIQKGDIYLNLDGEEIKDKENFRLSRSRDGNKREQV